jgi:16S rRNA (guanine966-N2)-methyltransferase
LDLRPTADRLRETLFNVLTAGDPNALEGRVWVDLFSGTGAVGIEALSRGAGMVYFVEKSVRATQLIRINLELLKVTANFQIMNQDSLRAARTLQSNGVQADIVFLDPPYRDEGAYQQSLDLLSQSKLLHPGSIVVAEHQKKFDPGDSFAGLRRYRKLVQGEAVLSFYRL